MVRKQKSHGNLFVAQWRVDGILRISDHSQMTSVCVYSSFYPELLLDTSHGIGRTIPLLSARTTYSLSDSIERQSQGWACYATFQ